MATTPCSATAEAWSWKLAVAVCPAATVTARVAEAWPSVLAVTCTVPAFTLSSE